MCVYTSNLVGVNNAITTSTLTHQRWIRLVYALICLLTACFADGYSAYIGNHALQIPLIEKIIQPKLFPHDPFAETLLSYSAPVWWLIAWMSRMIPLAQLLFVLFLVEKTLLLLSAASLARAMRPTSILAPWVAAVVVAVGVPALLGSSGPITPPYFEQTGASIPFFLFAFAALVQKKHWTWAICLALGTLLNPMYGVYAATYSIFGIMATDKLQWRRWLVPAAVVIILSLPALGFAIRSANTTSPDPHLWLEAARTRFSSHLVPFSWTIEQYLGFFVFLAILLAYALSSRRIEAGHTGEFSSAKFTVAAALCAVCWLGLAFVALYGLHSPKLLILHPARATDLWYFVGAIFLAVTCIAKIESGIVPQWYLSFPLLVLSLFHIRLLASRSLLLIITTALLFSIIILFTRRERHAQESSFSRFTSHATLAFTITVVSFFAIIRFCCIPSGGGSGTDTGSTAGEREVAAWARAHTTESALFLIPPKMSMFRALAERPVVATWKDGSAILWHRSYVTDWVRRMHDLGLKVAPHYMRDFPLADTPYPNPKTWNDTHIQIIGRRYLATYAILPDDHATQLPIIFAGRHGYMIVSFGGTSAIPGRHHP